MKKYLYIFSGIIFGTLLVGVAYAATPPLTVPQGGTGWGNIQVSTLLYGMGSSLRLATTSTTTLTASSPLSLSNPVAKVGGSDSVLSIDTSGAWSGNAGTATALAANGGNCLAGNYPLGVDALGAVENCTAVGAGSAFPFTPTTVGNSTSTLIQFSAGASTTLLSVFTTAYFGGTSTTTINGGTGTITLPSAASLIIGGITDKTLSTNVGGTVYGTATSTPTISSGLAYSGTLGNFVGGSSGNLTCATGSNTVFGCLTAANFNIFSNKLGTSSVLTAGNIIYATTNTQGNTVAGVATTTLAGTANQFTFTNSPIVIGASASVGSLANHVIFPSSYQAAFGSTTNATSTNLTVTATASTSKLFADGLSTCDATTGKITWSGGVFACGTDFNTGGGGFPFAPTTNYGAAANSTSTPIWFTAGIMASTTNNYFAGITVDNAAKGDGAFQVGTTSNEWTFGYASSTQNWQIASGTSVGNTNVALQIDKNLKTTLGGALTVTGQTTLATSLTGVLLGTSGVVSNASVQTCTNQFVRAMSASYVATCATVGAADVSLANLTATDSTLTFSGTYTGAAARTIGLNLGNANTWSVLQQFALASSTQFSAATETFYIDSTGKVIAKDTTNNWSGRLSPTRNLVLATATTTTWGGTTTAAYIPYSVAPFAGTLRSSKCQATTSAAFLGVTVFINNTKVTPTYFIASNTVGTISFTANNTFAAGDRISAYFGTTTTDSNAVGISCTLSTTES